MVDLRFTLTPEAAARVHDILTCLSRFSETVSIEARPDAFFLTTLNSSKTAFPSFTFDVNRFFSSYRCESDNGAPEVRFTCQIMCKALLSVFKGRLIDPRGRESTVERCEVVVVDYPEEAECRFVIKMFCQQGVIKTYRLTYEPAEVMHALFDKNSANNRWTIQSNMLKEYIDYFGTRTEHLDIYNEDDRVTFTSYTEKIVNGKEILKYPLRTAVSANKTDFDRFSAQDKTHTIINVRDFKTIVSHADTLKTPISAYYSQPTRPLQFHYKADGVVCEFTLMTRSANKGGAPSSAASTTPITRATSGAQSNTAYDHPVTGQSSKNDMPPPPVLPSRGMARRMQPPGSAKPATNPSANSQGDDDARHDMDSMDPDPESLFIPAQDDARWDPAESEEEEETLGWDASANNSGFQATFRDSGILARSQAQSSDQREEGLAPTQRLSQVQGGLW